MNRNTNCPKTFIVSWHYPSVNLVGLSRDLRFFMLASDYQFSFNISWHFNFFQVPRSVFWIIFKMQNISNFFSKIPAFVHCCQETSGEKIRIMFISWSAKEPRSRSNHQLDRDTSEISIIALSDVRLLQ